MARKVGQSLGRGRRTLRGPAKWTYFYLYVILHVFSRYAAGWMIAHAIDRVLWIWVWGKGPRLGQMNSFMRFSKNSCRPLTFLSTSPLFRI
jgi:transposase InsO family protein